MHRRVVALLLVFIWILMMGTVPAYAADITVDTLEDGIGVAGCSLREAIQSANTDNAGATGCAAGSGADRIVLSVSGEYTLTTGSHLSILSAITLEEATGVTATIQAHVSPNMATWRVFNVGTANGNLTLKGLTVRHGGVTGNGTGGCIRASGDTDLRLENSIVEACTSENYGGGIYASLSTVTIIDSVVQNNTLTGEGIVGVGGGLYSTDSRSVNIDGSIFSGNRIISSGSASAGGAYIHATRGNRIQIDNTTFNGNSVTATALPTHSAAAGGLRIAFGTGSATLSGLIFINNEVTGNITGQGGALITHNEAAC